MKKVVFTLGLCTAMILGACGSEETDSSTTENKSTSTNSENSTSSTEATEAAAPMEDYSLTVPEIEDMEIVNEVTYAFQESATDIVWASYYAEIKNNSKVPVDLSSSSVVYTDESGETVIMVSEMGLDVNPKVINPGETGFVNIYDPIQDVENFPSPYQANIEMQPIESIDQIVMHETESVNVIFNNDGAFPRIRATGKVKASAEVVGYDLAVIMYDAEGNFLGALTGGSDEDLLSEGQTTAFDIENPPFPDELMSEVAEWKAIAYSVQ